MLSSLLVLILFSVVIVGGAAHFPPSSTIRQRTLQDKDSSSSACPLYLEPASLCDVTTQNGIKCGFDFKYRGCGATEEELECLPEMTCTCDGIGDGTWACPDRYLAMTMELMPACPENGITVANERGKTCTPPPTTTSSSASSASSSSSNTISFIQNYIHVFTWQHPFWLE
mmetsp:Transcript_38518/g.41781  ORF Transcript_38518/g.41781 Transcript_38518/m.41781 type:complete len:171 (-) Transcript_38518:1105-1617(-)